MAGQNAANGKKILVVDDEEDLRDAIAFEFKRKGFSVSTACNGTEAFEQAQRDRPDLIISDIRMPGGDGIQLLNKIREVDSSKPALILVSGFVDLTVEEVYDRGADGFLPKPFERKALSEAAFGALVPLAEKWTLLGPSSETAGETRWALNEAEVHLGRGGLFVACKDDFPEVGARVQFEIRPTNGVGTPVVSGIGLVRWVRKGTENGLPAGLGLEFLQLSESTRTWAHQSLQTEKRTAFIPRK